MSSKPIQNNTVILQELYAETMTEQTILCAIQAHNVVQKPKTFEKNIMLLSYANDYKNSVLQCAAYGYWARTKKKCIFVLVDDSEDITIQNPRMIESLGKHFTSAIRSRSYKTSTNSRIHKGIQKHLAYITLLTTIDAVSIIHVPATLARESTTHEYLISLTNDDTMLIFLSNNTEDGLSTNDQDVITHALYKNITPQTKQQTDILQCSTTKEVFGIMRRTNYLHTAA